MKANGKKAAAKSQPKAAPTRRVTWQHGFANVGNDELESVDNVEQYFVTVDAGGKQYLFIVFVYYS